MHAAHGIDRKQAGMRGRRWAGAIGLALLLATGASSALAGSQERKGTGGAVELRIPVGPRGSALGPAVTADVSGAEAMFWNPAGIASLQGTEVLFSHTGYIADTDLNWAAVGIDLKQFGFLGLQAKVLSIGDIPVTTEDAPDGTGETISPTFTVLGLTYGRRFTDRVLFGGTVNYVSEKIMQTTAQGVAIDLGVQYFTGWNGLKFGIAMKNFGPSLSFSGQNFENPLPAPGSDPNARERVFSSESADFELPSYFSLAASYDVMRGEGQRLAVLGSFQNNNFMGDYLTGGAEWSYRDWLALRGSIFGQYRGRPTAIGEEANAPLRMGDDLYTGLALGVGVRVPVGGETRLGVDAAWRSVRSYFDDTLEIGLRLGL